MVKIKITTSFPTIEYGYLKAGKTVDVNRSFGEFCVKRIKAAEFVKKEKKHKKANKS